jgi:hypothetical protein
MHMCKGESDPSSIIKITRSGDLGVGISIKDKLSCLCFYILNDMGYEPSSIGHIN